MKVGIVGAGLVGSTAGYAMVLGGIATDIVFVDINAALARAQAEDILHATPVSNPARVNAGGYDALAGCSVVILACGASQKPGETRLLAAGTQPQDLRRGHLKGPAARSGIHPARRVEPGGRHDLRWSPPAPALPQPA